MLNILFFFICLVSSSNVFLNVCDTSAHCPGVEACGEITLTTTANPDYSESGYVCVNPEQCNGPIETHEEDGETITITFGNCYEQEAISEFWYGYVFVGMIIIMLFIQLDFCLKKRKDKMDDEVQSA